MTFLYRLYHFTTRLLTPFIPMVLRRRLRAGKEIPDRMQERLGYAGRIRPQGALIWFHCASIGESKSVQALISLLLSQNTNLHVLLTSGTITSAALMEEALDGDRSFHQFPPLDCPAFTDRFLDHWKPDLAIFIESEIWPNLLTGLKSRQIPTCLLNGRLSGKSMEGWLKRPTTAAWLFRHFHHISAQSALDMDHFNQIESGLAINGGNLKYDQDAPAHDAHKLSLASRQVSGRPVWFFASTHAGEEEIAAETHQALTKTFPDLLTVIMPRHPDRSTAITGMLEHKGLTVMRRSLDQSPTPETDIWLIDILGETGLWMRLCPITVMGGTFAQIGGHNFLEPALCQSAIISGPETQNFVDLTGRLEARSGMVRVSGKQGLKDQLSGMLQDADKREALTKAALHVAEDGRGATTAAYSQLQKLRPDIIQDLQFLHNDAV